MCKPNNITVRKLYMFPVFPITTPRLPYALYGSAASVYPGEPFMVSKTNCQYKHLYTMVMVCNVRGELGLVYPLPDIVPYDMASQK